MIDFEEWGDQLPKDAIEQLRKAYHQTRSQSGITILTPERTAFLLDRFHELKKTLKRSGCIQIPLMGKIGK